MQRIIVDQYKGNEKVSVYVRDNEIDDFLEAAQDIPLVKAYKLIEVFKRQYNVKEIQFILYNNYDVIIELDTVFV